MSQAPFRLSIIVPIYNEEHTLQILIDRLIAACGQWSQVIYVDDGSRDSSLDIARKNARSQDVVLTKKNAGKGSAVREGIPYAKGMYTIIQDADLEYSPEEIPALLEHAERHGYEAVFGSRRLKKQKQYAHIAYYMGGTLLTYIFNILYGTRLTDQPTCYKLIDTKVLQGFRLHHDDFRLDAEVSVALVKVGHRIHELPISYAPRTRADGKKIGWKDWVLSVGVFLALWSRKSDSLTR